MNLRALLMVLVPACGLVVAPLLAVPASAASSGRLAAARKSRPAHPKKPPPPPAAEPTPAPEAAAPAPEVAAPAPAAPAATEAPAAPPAAAHEEPARPPSDKSASPGPGADLGKLRAEHDALRDALFRSRARRETVEAALFSTQVLTTLKWDANRHYTLKQAELRLDGVRFWNAETPPGEDPVTLAPRSLPPGTHVLGVRIEVRSRENPKLGYVSEQSFTLALPEGKQTKVEVTIDEEGGLPSYNPDIEVEVSH